MLHQREREHGPAARRVFYYTSRFRQQAATAKQWSVLSVPTTFILDRDGRPRQVNHGYASTEKLFGQIAALGQT